MRNPAKPLFTLLATLLALAAGTAGATPTLLDTNLVVNGDAQASTTTTGWVNTHDRFNLGVVVTTNASQATTVGLPPGVVIGARSFWGGGVDSSNTTGASTKSLSQRITLSGWDAEIDAGLISADWATLLQSRATDKVTATVSFLDATLANLDTHTYVDTNGLNAAGTSYAAFDWSSITDSFALPGQTRFVDIQFTFTRTSGFSTDALVDNVSFKLTQTGTIDPNGVPEPGTLALLAAASLGLLLPALRRQAR